MRNLLLRKKPQWKIIDEKGNTIAKRFRCKTSARTMIPRYKLNKRDKLEVVEDETN